MWSNIIDGPGLFSNWQALSAVLIAIPIGLIFGILPGLSGLTALAILIPFVYGMEPFVGLAFLITAHAFTTTSGALPSILLGIPGTPPSGATVIDGYPLSKQGRGGYASGADLASSAIGGVLGCIAFALLIPILQPIILSFGSPEMFILMLIGLLFCIAFRIRWLTSFSVSLASYIFIALVFNGILGARLPRGVLLPMRVS